MTDYADIEARLRAAYENGWGVGMSEALCIEAADALRDLRAVVSACHEAIGESPASDDATLAEGIRMRLAAGAESDRRAEALMAETERLRGMEWKR